MKKHIYIAVILTAFVTFLFYTFIIIPNVKKKVRDERETTTDGDGCLDTMYQFYVTDDSITVYDYGRIVGTVKLEGQLDSLIIDDNQ